MAKQVALRRRTLDKVVAIIQARMGSTRLPGKVMADLGGRPVLERVVDRTSRARLVDQVVVATTLNSLDDVIAEACAQHGWNLFRGSENDVLDRYYQTASAYEAGVIVRVTCDCPLIEPEIIDRVVRAHLETRPDYASNTLKRTYPLGLDVEAMTSECLARAWREATLPWHRTHVTPYIYNNPASFRLLSVLGEADYSNYRWTLDGPEDLAFLREVYARVSNNDTVSWREVLKVLTKEPQLAEINRNIVQKPPERR